MPQPIARRRHVPLRSCVICGNKTSKRDLARIVATPQGGVLLDPTGRLPGRGAYVCKDRRCATKELKRGRFEYALRTKLRDEQWKALISSIGVSNSLG